MTPVQRKEMKAVCLLGYKSILGERLLCVKQYDFDTILQSIVYLLFLSKLTGFRVTWIATQSSSWEVMNTVYSGIIYTLQKVGEKTKSTTLNVMKKLLASCFCGRLVE